MKNPTSLVLLSLMSLGFLLLATNACECGDAGLQEATPSLEVYSVNDSGTSPAADQMTPIPDDDHIQVDMGQVDAGVVKRRFVFLRNTGRGDLQLVSAQVNPNTSTDMVIGCLQGAQFITDCAFGDNRLNISPGHDLVIEIDYAPAESGSDSGSISLQFNVLTHQNVTVDITGQAVTPEIQVCFSDCIGDQGGAECSGAGPLCNDEVERDQFILDFGDIHMNDSAMRIVTIRNQGQRPLNVSSIALADMSHGQYTLDTSSSGLPGELQPDDEAQVLITFSPQWGGLHAENLIVQSSDVNEPEVLVKLSGQGIAPRVCPDPMLLDFGNVQIGAPVVKTFTLESCGLEVLNLQNLQMASGSSPDFSLPTPPAMPANYNPGESVEVEVQYYPQTAGSDSGGVEIFSNDQSADPNTGLTGTVVLKGNAVEKACDIQATPFAVNFGVVVVGNQPTMDVVVANVGTDPCDVSDIRITANTPDDEFSLSNFSGATTLQPGDMTTVQVGYDPSPPLGQDTGILSVFANDKDTDEVKIDLNAFSVPPDGDGPIAVCSVTPNQDVPPFTTVTWDGSQSYDSNNRPITEYRWNIFAFPPGSGATIQGSGATRTSVVDFAGDYIASLVVVNDLGQTSDTCYATATVVPTQDLWIEMFWQHSGDDMDLHLLAPGGIPRTNTDCFYANCVPVFGHSVLDWGQQGYSGDDPRLDRDDIPGDGPENINIANPVDGRYTVFVNDYPGHSYVGGNEVTVKIYIDGVLAQEFVKTITGENEDWYVCNVDWPSGNINPL